MYTQCATEKAAAQQKMFEDAMLELMLEKPAEDIFISELCRKTGLSRKIFYRLYETKADVIYAMIDHTLLEAASFVPDESVGPGGLHRFLAFWQSKKSLLDVLAQNQISPLLQHRMVNHILHEAPEIVDCFGASDSEYREEIIVFYVSGLVSLVLDWHYKGFDRSIDQLSALIMQLLMEPPVKSMPVTGNGN